MDQQEDPSGRDMFNAAGTAFAGNDRRAPLRDALERWGAFGPGQTAGRFWPVACVALEVTQRCNLDCTLCYLSETAEALHDVPLALLLDRIGMIESHYGPGVSIQLTGGDPTLRSLEDLEALCREIRRRGMRSCLMTNGVRAKRPFLVRLAEAGLDDVAFHVDVTQERKGYANEAALDAVRSTYLDRARGLGLRVLFNTTVFAGNIGEVAHLARFFRRHAGEIALASFQLQADTGRGVLRERAAAVTPDRVAEALAEGTGTSLAFDTTLVGHSACNRYTSVVVAGAEARCPLIHKKLAHRLIDALTKHEQIDDAHLAVRATLARVALMQPDLALAALATAARLAWSLRRGLWQSRGRVHRLAFLIHNFMDAAHLDRARCESCVFMVATAKGPLSMCVQNANRDAHLLEPQPIETSEGRRWWDAATGELQLAGAHMAQPEVIAKHRKGRVRVAGGTD